MALWGLGLLPLSWAAVDQDQVDHAHGGLVGARHHLCQSDYVWRVLVCWGPRERSNFFPQLRSRKASSAETLQITCRVLVTPCPRTQLFPFQTGGHDQLMCFCVSRKTIVARVIAPKALSTTSPVCKMHHTQNYDRRRRRWPHHNKRQLASAPAPFSMVLKCKTEDFPKVSLTAQQRSPSGGRCLAAA